MKVEEGQTGKRKKNSNILGNLQGEEGPYASPEYKLKSMLSLDFTMGRISCFTTLYF